MRHVALPGWLQAAVLIACLVSVGGIAYLATGFARLHAAVDQQIEQAQATPLPAPATTVDSAKLAELQDELAQMHKDLATANRNYAEARSRDQQTQAKLATLSAENDKLQTGLKTATLQVKRLTDARNRADHRAKAAEQALNSKADSLSHLARNLDDNKSELRQSEAARTTLQNRVQQLQMELQAAKAGAAQEASTQSSQSDAKHQPRLRQQVATEPPHTTSARTGKDAVAAKGTASKAVAPVPERKPDHIPPHAQARTSELERLLASTGLDVDRLLKSLDSHSAKGEGGPYIALNGPRAAELEQNRRAELKKLAKSLPLRAPLNHYEIDSGFGPRIDPINHRASFHPGLDLGAPYKTPVYSTAPGKVIFTGWEEGYGRTVKISHGHGIVTLYAHLHRILVARGQKVGAHVEIGQLGSTGRSTGPHLHYEVDVDGTPLDPAKFMKVGKNVVQISGK